MHYHRSSSRRAIAWAMLLAGLTCASLRQSAGAEVRLPLRFVADVSFAPAGKDFADQTPRMDYEAIDAVRRMLYVAYLGADEVVAFDLKKRKVVAHITGLAAPHGTLAIAPLGRLYVSATGADQIAVVDEHLGSIIARTAGGDYPDGMAYDPELGKVFVSDEHGGTETVVDVRTNKALGRIDLGGEAGNTQFDQVARLVYVDVQTRDEIAVLDPKSDRVVARHKLMACDHDHGLALDAVHRLAFVACDGNATLLLVDLTNWEILSRSTVGSVPDVMAFDQGLARLYVASESGVVAVFLERGRALAPLGTGFLASGAHTVAVDPKSHLVYFALADVLGRPTIRIMEPTTN